MSVTRIPRALRSLLPPLVLHALPRPAPQNGHLRPLGGMGITAVLLGMKEFIVSIPTASVVTSKPANGGHGKTGQWTWPGTRLFYSAESSACKFVFVRQLRGPHLST